jgi:6-phosphogluconate dehydrogenase
MQLGMIGLGRMGANLVRRARKAGHTCVVHDRDAGAVADLVAEGSVGAASLEELVAALQAPRAVWIMVPAAVTGAVVDDLAPLLEAGDTVIDGGNSFYRDDIRRARSLADSGIAYLDVGTSGGVHGLDRGYCLMIGGDADAVTRLQPIFEALAPGVEAAPRSPSRLAEPPGPAEHGWLHCGPSGAGHFVKMVHNGIEYGVMAAYAEGLSLLAGAGLGDDPPVADAETAPLRNPDAYRYHFELDEVAEVWRRGSVIGSWLLDLTADSLRADPRLDGYEGRVADSGEGRWTVQAAVDLGVPLDVITAALFQRFGSRGGDDVANRVLSAMRHGFGGHVERTTDADGPTG